MIRFYLYTLQLQHQEEFYQLNAIQEAVNKFEEQRQIEHAKKKREYRESLQDQMIEKHKRKIEDYKMELKDKALIDDSVKVLEEADKRLLSFFFLCVSCKETLIYFEFSFGLVLKFI